MLSRSMAKCHLGLTDLIFYLADAVFFPIAQEKYVEDSCKADNYDVNKKPLILYT